MKRNSGLCWKLIVLCCFLTQLAVPQTPELYSDAPTVRISVSVKVSGAYIADLRQEDFTLLEDSQSLSLDSCDFDRLPLDLLFVSDVFSLDYARDGNNLVMRLGDGFLAMPSNDRIAGIRLYKGSVEKVFGLTTDHSAPSREFNTKKW